MGIQTTLTLRIDWSELDLFAHVNNVMFMKYVQAARLQYCEHIGLMELHRSQNIGFMVAETNCKFKKALHFPGNVHIVTRQVSIGNTSFVLEHQLMNDAQQLAAIATDVLVVYDFSRNEKYIIPADMKSKM